MSTTVTTSESTTLIVTEEGAPQVIIAAGGATRPQKATTYSNGNVTLKNSDLGRVFVSQDPGPVNYFLPKGLGVGEVTVFQGGDGQITFTATEGATIIDGQLRSAGNWSEGYWTRVYSLGNDTFMIIGDTAEGILKWSIIGQRNLNEGDVATYVMFRPDTTGQFPSGVTLTVTGSDFLAAGFDMSLVQALQKLADLEDGVTFDGVDQLTILPTARNPLPLQMFAEPRYTATTDRNVSITISNPSNGTVSDTAGTITTAVKNTSRPISPAELFPTYNATTALVSAINATTITLEDASGIDKYARVTFAGVPALTYVTNISGNTITLSAALTAGIAAGSILTFTPPGYVLNFTTSTGMTLNGSNQASTVLDAIHGYPFDQATLANRPIYDAASLNGKGGMNFNGSKWLRSSNPAICNINDDARARSTTIVIGRINSITNTGYWLDGSFGFQANTSASAFHQTGGAGGGPLEMPPGEILGKPQIFMYENDGTVDAPQVHVNNQRIYIPGKVTALAASGQRTILVDDTSSMKVGMGIVTEPFGGLKTTVPSTIGAPGSQQYVISNIDSATQIRVNQNLVENLLADQPIKIFTTMLFGRAISPAKTTTNVTIGSSKTGTFSMQNATMYYVIHVPRILTMQEKRGLHLWLSSELSTTATTTADGAVAAGERKIKLASVADVCLYQGVSGTNIKTGSTVVKINSTTKEIWLDEPVQSGGISDGATITLKYLAIKIPELISLAPFVPTFRDDFVNGLRRSNSGIGWKPYYGDPANPGTFAGAYGALGHGSSNNGANEKEWYLDDLNYLPWRSYTPFSQFSDSDVAKGGLKITASPTADAIKDLVGYAPPQPTAYPYTSGLIRDAGGFMQQYGYWEARLKTERVIGVWTAFWMLAVNGGYPPEIDVWEGYGFQSATIQTATHLCKTFNLDFAQRAVSNGGDIMADFSEQYLMFGVEVTPDEIIFYLNRERFFSTTMQWDFHTPWFMILNMAVQAAQGGATPDLVTPMAMWCDYAAAWRRPDQTIAPTGTTQAETTALVAAMSVAPSGARQTLINTAIEKLKLYKTSFGVSLWSALDVLVVPAAHDAQAARINWKDPSNIGTVVGTPTFTVDRGYAGVLNTSYIDMGTVLSTASSYALNSALNQSHVGSVVANVTGTTAIAIGTTNFNVNPRSGNGFSFKLWGAGKVGGIASAGGHLLSTRNHFQYTFYHNGGWANGGYGTGIPQAGSNTHTTDTETLKIANGTARVALAHAGDYLTPDDVRYLYAVIYEYLHALGAL